MDLGGTGWNGMSWIDLAQDRDDCQGVMVSIKGGEYLDWLGYCQLLKKDCASWGCCAVILAVSLAKRNARILGMFKWLCAGSASVMCVSYH